MTDAPDGPVKSLPLVFDAPRGRGKPPRHLADLSAAERKELVAGARSLARDEVPGGPGRVSNVVFMGMGKPLANYRAVVGAVRRLTDKAPDGLGMSARGINDQGWRADLLGEVLTSYGDWGWVHVNLIPLNPTPGSRWTASRREDEREFVRRL